MEVDEVITFKSAEEMEKWFEKHHLTSKGIWLRMFKKNSDVVGVKGSDALDIALCYGWITGQARPYDNISALWRFVPRRPKSLWSKINTGHAERLVKAGRMRSAGMRQIDAAKEDGRWESAYSPQREAKVPIDFKKELNKNGDAKKFFKTLNRSSVYAIIFRLETTRNKDIRKEKIKKIIKMLESGEKFH